MYPIIPASFHFSETLRDVPARFKQPEERQARSFLQIIELLFPLHPGWPVGDIHPDPFKQIELRLDLSIMLCRLTPRQKEFCPLLGEEGLTVNEVSGRLKVPRTSLYDEIKSIRAIQKYLLSDQLHQRGKDQV